jgi:hypothetical protein
MDLSAPALIASLILGLVGFVLFGYGKKQARAPQMVAGVVLMIGPYFTATAALTWGLGVVVIGALWWVVRIGW